MNLQVRHGPPTARRARERRGAPKVQSLANKQPGSAQGVGEARHSRGLTAERKTVETLMVWPVVSPPRESTCHPRGTPALALCGRTEAIVSVGVASAA